MTTTTYNSVSKTWRKVVAMNVRVWDNKGVTIDRYAVLNMDTARIEGPYTVYDCLSMSENPDSPAGACMAGTANIGSHLGVEIEWRELPERCKSAVKRWLLNAER